MIKLVRPDYSYKEKILIFKQEFYDNSENSIPESELLDKMNSFDDWLNYIEKNSNRDTVSSDWVVSDCFIAVEGQNVVGIVSLRHELNDFLKNFGHIGYSVVPSKRRQNIATLMLKEILNIARSIGLNEVLLSALEDNVASVRTIEKNGGKYVKTFSYNNQKVKRFVVKL